MALAVGEAAVLDGHAVAEGLAKGGRHRRRERDLGHQHQHSSSAGADAGREPEVDLGLAAAGDAVQQRDAKFMRCSERCEKLSSIHCDSLMLS